MSWYRDPQLFIYGSSKSSLYVYRIKKEFNSNPIVPGDYTEQENLNFSKHLSFGNIKETDFDAFKVTFEPKSGIYKFINSKGLVIDWDLAKQRGTWSREEPNSPFWSLPGITKQESITEKLLADKQALADENSELKAKISSLQEEAHNKKVEKEAADKRIFDLEAENSHFKTQVNGKRDEKILTGLEALQQQVMDLTSKLDQCCGAAGDVSPVEEPWVTGQTVPSNWVSFGELDVLPLSKNPSLTITKAAGGSKFGDDKTTNIQAKCFYRGVYSIVVVDVSELTPNREEARFDPRVWGLYENAGVSYAARKSFASEILVDAHKTC